MARTIFTLSTCRPVLAPVRIDLSDFTNRGRRRNHQSAGERCGRCCSTAQRGLRRRALRRQHHLPGKRITVGEIPGVSANYADITNIVLKEGRFISELDDQQRERDGYRRQCCRTPFPRQERYFRQHRYEWVAITLRYWCPGKIGRLL